MKKSKHQYYSWRQFEKDVLIIAGKIIKTGKKFDGIYGPPRGGLPLAVKLSHLLNLPFLKKPMGKKTLIVDDIADKGDTLLPFHKGGYFIATIFYKRHCKFVPNIWIREKKERIVDFPWEKSIKNGERKAKTKFVLQKSSIHGNGIYAAADIIKGKTIVDFSKASGRFISEKMADLAFWKKGKDYVLQTGDHRYWSAKGRNADDCWFLNHSCNPNLGINGRFRFVSLRNIKAGEELTFDYAMSESSNYTINCKCGSKICRKTITGNDYKLKSLQKKYEGFFSDYLKRKIEILTKTENGIKRNGNEKPTKFIPKPKQVDFTNARYAPVINCVVKNGDKILIVKRSKNLNFYPGYWNGISGFLDDKKTVEQKVKEELKEELGINAKNIKKIRVGEIFHQNAPKYRKTWIVHPILVEIDTDKISLDWEAQNYEWIRLAGVKRYKLLPGFDRVLKKLFP